MTVELVLLLGIYAFIILGAFLGPMGPVATFKKSAPRLAARIERNIAVGEGFNDSNGNSIKWEKPPGEN